MYFDENKFYQIRLNFQKQWEQPTKLDFHSILQTNYLFLSSSLPAWLLHPIALLRICPCLINCLPHMMGWPVWSINNFMKTAEAKFGLQVMRELLISMGMSLSGLKITPGLALSL